MSPESDRVRRWTAARLGGRATGSAGAILCLEGLGLLLGLATFASDPLGFAHPEAALYAIGSLTLVSAAVRVLGALRARARLARSLEILALFLYATSLTWATGLTNSPFLALYAVPLWAAALTCRLWQVIALALLTVGLTLLQSGFLDSMNDMHLPTTTMVLLDALAPAIAAALIIVKQRTRREDIEHRSAGLDSPRRR